MSHGDKYKTPHLKEVESYSWQKLQMKGKKWQVAGNLFPTGGDLKRTLKGWALESVSCIQLFATAWTRLLCPWNSPGKNTGVDCHSLRQRIFLTQGLNPGLLHRRQILYHVSYREVLIQPITSDRSPTGHSLAAALQMICLQRGDFSHHSLFSLAILFNLLTSEHGHLLGGPAHWSEL